MRKFRPIFLLTALVLILLSASCAPATVPPISTQAATLAALLTSSPIAGVGDTTPVAGTPSAAIATTLGTTTVTTGTLAAVTTQTASIPVTGNQAPVLICQFCLDQIPYSLVAIAEVATFSMMDANGAVIQQDPTGATGCNSVQTFNGRQLLLCRGTEPSTIRLNVCTDTSNCVEVPVKLQSCPLSGTGEVTEAAPAIFDTATPGALATDTNTPSAPAMTPTP